MLEGPQILLSNLQSTTSQGMKSSRVLFQGTSHNLVVHPGCLWALWHHCPPTLPLPPLSPCLSLLPPLCNSGGHSFRAQPSYRQGGPTLSGVALACWEPPERKKSWEEHSAFPERAWIAAQRPAHGQRVGEIVGRKLMLDLRLTGESGGSCHMSPTWIRALHCAALRCTGSGARQPGFESCLCCVLAMWFAVPQFAHL